MGDTARFLNATLAAALPECRFDGSNLRAFDVALAAWSQYYGCANALETDRPEEGDDLRAQQQSWDEQNQRAILCLSRCVDPTILQLLRDAEGSTAKAMLETLRELFPSAERRDFTLHAQLIECQQGGMESIIHFAAKLHEILTGLENAGEAIADGLKVTYLCKKLNAQWRQFGDMLMSQQHDITYNSFRARLFKQHAEG
jgi:hypothetical protein